MVERIEHTEPHAGRSSRRRRSAWVAGTGVAAVAAFVAVWFQPQKLFIDDTVNEPLPSAAAAPGPEAMAPSMADATPMSDATTGGNGSVEVAGGRFVSLDHGTSGVVRVLDVGARRVVRLEDLETSNGPDLFVYLSTNPAGGTEAAFDDDYVSLGRLKGNQGDQNHELPADVDLARFRSVVIWCDRFNSAFGAADLSAR